MFNPATVLATAFADHLVDGYRMVYGRRDPDHGSTIRAMAQLAVERISSSDALYHDVNHTVLVTLVGQTILRGQHHGRGGRRRRTGCTSRSPPCATTSATCAASAPATRTAAT